MVDSKKNCPMARVRAFATRRHNLFLERELTDEFVTQVSPVWIILLPKDSQPLMTNQLRKILALAGKLGARFATIVPGSKEQKAGPSLRLIPFPNRSHEIAMMLAEIIIKKLRCNICRVHQMLHD